MWSIPAVTAARSTPIAEARSGGALTAHGPANCIAPYPDRLTRLGPSGNVDIGRRGRPGPALRHFKTWVDMVITDPRMAAGTQPVLAGKPAVLVTVRGGNYRPGTPREGWDHATGWMRRILADVWHLDLKVVEAEFTLVGVNPALDQFNDLARQLRREAEEQARRHGRELGAAVATAPLKAA